MPDVTTGAVTEREIRSQPEIWHEVVAHLPGPPPAPQAASHLVTGCGSTFYVARWLARHAERALGVPVRALPSSDLLLEPATWSADADTPLLAVSRSGSTTETVRVLREWTGPRLSVTCDAASPLGEAASFRLDLDMAGESSVVQTRAFTSMLLGSLACYLPVPDGLGPALEEAGRAVVAASDELVTATLAERTPSRIVLLGSGPRYGLACEAALKLTEVALIEAQAFHTLEVRHGPMSRVGDDTLVIALVDGDSPLERATVEDMAALGATTRVIAATPVADADLAPPVELPEGWRDVVLLPFVQLLAIELARRDGLDPDTPRNLAAVVTLDD